MDKNLEAYNSKQVVKWYLQLREILPVEKVVFEHHSNLLSQGTLLDIGIGGGRTTSYLLKRCGKYTGIDYSRSFISRVKKEFPDAECFVMDARELSDFRNASFDFVNFSFNGMDYVDLNGRKKILSEVSRVLKPGGVFFFSTHNKSHSSFHKDPWVNKNNNVFTNFKTFVKLLPFFPRKIVRGKHELIQKEYAVINDSAHNYRLMTFYTTPSFLRQQLADAGFEEPCFYHKSGAKKKDSELEDWIFASASKISA